MDILLGIIIFLFSVVFPIMKLGVFYNILSGGNPNGWFSKFVHITGDGSLCLMFMSSLFSFWLSEAFLEERRIQPSWGLILFTISVLLSLYVSKRLEA